jgi:hypothetical protein
MSYADLMAANANLATATDGEASELVFITPDTALCFPLHQAAVNEAFQDLGMAPKIVPAKAFKP